MSAAQPPNVSIAASASQTPGFGRPSAEATLRASVPVMRMPAVVIVMPSVCPGLRRSPRNTTTRITATATYAPPIGLTIAIGPSASAL